VRSALIAAFADFAVPTLSFAAGDTTAGIHALTFHDSSDLP